MLKYDATTIFKQQQARVTFWHINVFNNRAPYHMLGVHSHANLEKTTQVNGTHKIVLKVPDSIIIVNTQKIQMLKYGPNTNIIILLGAFQRITRDSDPRSTRFGH